MKMIMKIVLKNMRKKKMKNDVCLHCEFCKDLKFPINCYGICKNSDSVNYNKTVQCEDSCIDFVYSDTVGFIDLCGDN